MRSELRALGLAGIKDTTGGDTLIRQLKDLAFEMERQLLVVGASFHQLPTDNHFDLSTAEHQDTVHLLVGAGARLHNLNDTAQHARQPPTEVHHSIHRADEIFATNYRRQMLCISRVLFPSRTGDGQLPSECHE